MSLIYDLSEPKDMLRKVAYEGNLLLWTENQQWLAYSLFNFCVSAHSLRDWSLKHLQIPPSQEEGFHTQWNKVLALVVVRDIANSSKHFGLRRATPVTNARPSVTTSVPFFTYEDFENPRNPIEKPSYEVVLSDGSMMEIHDLVVHSYGTWIDFFKYKSIPMEHPLEKAELLAELFLRPDIFRQRN